MSDLIDREDAIQAAKHAWAKGIEPSQYIEIIPSVDAVEVVRCKDCDNERWCKIAQYHGPNGFCSYGERKEG